MQIWLRISLLLLRGKVTLDWDEKLNRYEIALIDNSSGHFKPHGDHIAALVVQKFREAGYTVVRDDIFQYLRADFWKGNKDPRFPGGFPLPRVPLPKGKIKGAGIATLFYKATSDFDSSSSDEEEARRI